jgi:preprotein translocase subunit SecE
VARKDAKSSARRQQNAVQRYINETIGELRKVSWPTRKEATNLTAIVIVVTVAVGILLGLLDFIYTKVFALLFA